MRWALPMVCLLAAGCSDFAITLPLTLPLPGTTGGGHVGGGIHRIALPRGAGADCASPDACALVRAAEAARRAGGTHFMLLPGHGGPTQRGYAYIRVFTFAAGEGAPSGAMSVEEALYFFRRPPSPSGSGAAGA